MTIFRPRSESSPSVSSFVEDLSSEERLQLHCRIPAALHEYLRVRSARERVAINDLVINALYGFYSADLASAD